jgi:hypothetical protein
MNRAGIKKTTIILAHAFVGWALCGVSIAIGKAITSMDNTLIIHAVAVPVIFTAVSLVYFRKFNFTTPLQTAVIFVGFVILMDLLVVCLLIEHNFDLFKSILGSWIPDRNTAVECSRLQNQRRRIRNLIYIG